MKNLGCDTIAGTDWPAMVLMEKSVSKWRANPMVLQVTTRAQAMKDKEKMEWEGQADRENPANVKPLDSDEEQKEQQEDDTNSNGGEGDDNNASLLQWDDDMFEPERPGRRSTRDTVVGPARGMN